MINKGYIMNKEFKLLIELEFHENKSVSTKATICKNCFYLVYLVIIAGIAYDFMHLAR